MMPTLLVKFVAARGNEAALQQALHALAAGSKNEGGCDVFQAHRVPEAPGQFLLYERWRDEAALAEHNRGPSVSRFRALLPTLVSADPEVSMLDSIGP